jgi:GPI mannosyltransferase 1 subunit M
VASGFLYGLSVHFKIYPIIYSFVLYFLIDVDYASIKNGRPYLAIYKNGFFTRNRLVFTAVSAGTFIGLTYLFYVIYGYEFVYEAYLYHFVRKDHRHNNSVYWYMIY